MIRRSCPLLFFAFAVLTPILSAAANDSWPAFRGPNGDGIVPASSNPPSQWSTDRNIAWRSELPGQGWSSPVTDGKRIYLSSAIPDGDDASSDFMLSLLVVDAKNGSLLKTIQVMPQSAEHTPRIHKKNTHASPTPILHGDRIYVHFGYQGTACLDLNGKIIWVNRELFFKPTHGNGGTPILVDGLLVFTCDGGKQPKIVALNAETGQLVWQTPRPVSAKKTFSFCTPTVIEVQGRKQIIAPGSDCVLALDPSNGETVWDVRYDGYSVVPKPVFDQGLVFISTSFDDSKMLAIRPTGRGIVTDTHVQWQQDKFVPKTPSMIAHQRRVYAVSDNGIMTCIDAETGDIVYRQRLGGNFSASPLLAGDRLYFTSEEGVTTVVRTGDQYEQVAQNDLGERTLASPAVLGNSILMRTANALYRIEQP
ncbi:MAG: PQQ-binding-like beta-propeller repeat protein [Pirellulales bacterium]|nr:PQQ-binding-like beta-propeller repeat protein [Pirellulales bacterium]